MILIMILFVTITYVNAAATSCVSLESPYVFATLYDSVVCASITPPRNSIRHAANDGVQ